jgi:hypothetical protein
MKIYQLTLDDAAPQYFASATVAKKFANDYAKEQKALGHTGRAWLESCIINKLNVDTVCKLAGGAGGWQDGGDFVWEKKW